ncbi:MAG: serine/threonine-protein kinase [Anaerolineae bacterium]|nr:serine/threonine-protein kinase [Anaerolineae bacterium]MDQ7037513.1 serine/threonine-protein kinase [Anaerolineae bacterium]
MTVKQQDPLIGKTIDGYFIEKLLGQGGMARVYRAMDVKLKRYAAFKVIDYSSRHTTQYEERFDREARAIAKLSHPNIVAIYRFNEANDMYYMAMEYVDGADLHWVLQDYQLDDGLMDYVTLLEIMQQVADALDYAHENGVIHRDIKPSNIMISRDGRAILTDFGLALDVTEGTKGEIFGSPHYIAPEQAINSKTVQPQTDVYSLGVILYEILTGVVPFHEGTTFEIAMKHISEPIPDPLQINPKLHPAFLPILQKAMAKDIENRYPTCNALMRDLREAIAKANESKQVPAGLDTRSRPSERISLKITPLPAAVAGEPKPPTMIVDMARQKTLPSVASRQTAATESGTKKPDKSRQGSRLSLLLAIVLLIIVTVTGYGALNYYGITIAGVPPIISTANRVPNAVIEGRVESINGRTVTIYDIPVLLDRNADILDIAPNRLIGKILRIEGRYSSTNNGLEFTEITSFLVDNAPLEDVEDDG